MSTTPHADDREENGIDARAQQLGVVVGDRLCARCGFNLHGQTIVREPHYGMLCLRCPECSTIAALQEFPVLGKWAPRAGLVLALGWAVAVLVLALLTGLSLYAGAESVATAATRPAARQIGTAFKVYAAANQEPAGSGTIYAEDMAWTTRAGDAADFWVDPSWLRSHKFETVPAPALDGRTIASAIPFLIGAAAWGALWSVLLLHRGLRGRCIFGGVIAILAGAVVALAHTAPDTGQPAGWNPFAISSSFLAWGVPASDAARRMHGLPTGLLACAAGFVAMCLGLGLGRKLARVIVRILLPPHLRGPLAALWHVDGLPSPPTRRELWLRG